jgi:hypothetical protein
MNCPAVAAGVIFEGSRDLYIRLAPAAILRPKLAISAGMNSTAGGEPLWTSRVAM